MKNAPIYSIPLFFLLIVFPVSAATITFTVNASTVAGSISPYIYGANSGLPSVKNTVFRSGGNRLSAYNWETNWSNAGSDYLFENDTLMGSVTNGPGWAFTSFHTANKTVGADSLVTIQLAGYVSANGETAVQVPAADYMNAPGLTDPHGNFYPVTFIKPGSPGSYADPPNAADGVVYTDEMVKFLVNHLGNAASGGIKFYDLDNEPGAWTSTHIEVHNYPVSYIEVATKGITVAQQTTLIDPGAQILGPVCFGWGDAINMSGAPDQGTYNPTYDNGNWVPFMNYYLAQMNAASTAAGRRLLHYLDFHAYSEGTDAAGNRINNADVSQDAATTRMQLPRELWDPTFTENNWISCCVAYGPMTLIPRFQAAINQYYPGTKVAFSEYDYGGGGDVSGGIAEADTLGAFGRYGAGLACLWDVGAGDQYLTAAYNMYLNYDGANSKFGDTSISATSNNVPEATVWAARDNSYPNRINVVVLNKDYSLNNTGTVILAGLAGGQQISSIRAFRFDSAISVLSPSTAPAFTATSFTDTLPFRSGTLYEVTMNLAFNTFTPTPTNSPLATSTFTPTATATPTGTLPTATFTRTFTSTSSFTPTPSPTPLGCPVLLNGCESLTENGTWSGTNATRALSTSNATQLTHSLQVNVTTANNWNNQIMNLSGFAPNVFSNVGQIIMDVYVSPSLISGTSTWHQLALLADSASLAQQPISDSPNVNAGANSVTFNITFAGAGFTSATALTELWIVYNTDSTGLGSFYVDNIRLVQSPCPFTPTFTPTGAATNTPTLTPTNSPTKTQTTTVTNTATRTPTTTATNSLTASPTNSANLTRTNSATVSPTNSFTRTATITPSNSPTNSLTVTPTNTFTSSPTNTFTGTLPPTHTATPSPANSLSPTGTNTATRTPTATLSFTRTSMPTNIFTNSPTPTATRTETNSPTTTTTNTATHSPIVTSTFTPTPATIQLSTGLPAPSNTTELPGASNVVVLSVALTNTGNTTVNFTSLTVSDAGTGIPSGISGVNLLNNGSPIAGPVAFAGTLATFNGLSVNIPASGSVTLQVTVSFSNAALAGSYQFSVTGGAGTNGQAVNFNGLPSMGATITIAFATATFTNTLTSSQTFTPTPTPSLTASPTKTIMGTPTGTLAATTTAGKIILYPNPADGTQPVSLRLNLTSPSNVKVQVFTTAFRKVLEQSYSQQPVGMDVALNLSDKWGSPLASGLYYVVVIGTPQTGTGQNQTRSVGKLLILR